MNRCTNWLMGWGLAALLAAGAGCVKQQHVEIQIEADGTSTLTMRAVMARASVEQMVRMREGSGGYGGGGGGDVWDDEQWDQNFDAYIESQFDTAEALEDEAAVESEGEAGADPGGDPGADPAAEEPAETDADDDEALAERVKALFTEQMNASNPLSGIEGVEMELTDVTVTDDEVEMIATITAASLDALVEASPHLLDDFGVEGIRLEETDGGNLRLTLVIPDDPARRAQSQQIRQYLKASKVSGSFVVTLPGAIVSSSLPEVEGGTTRIEFDTAEDEQIDALIEMFSDDIVIEAEPGGLDLSALPLEPDPAAAMAAMAAAMAGGQSGYAALPLEDPEGAFTAEPLMVTQKSVHYYPGAAEVTAAQPYMMYDAGNVCRVEGRLYAPRGRYVLSLQSARATRAEDDQGRPVEPMGGTESMGHIRMSGDDDRPISADMTLSLELPPADAQALEVIEGEAIVVTFEGWNELTINPAEPAPQEVIDLEGVLSGAKLIVRDVRHVSQDEEHGGQLQGAAQVELVGPSEVTQVEVMFRGGGDQMNVNSYVGHEATREHEGQTQRRMIVQYQMWSFDGTPSEQPHLVVRTPRGVKRVKVPFTLEAVDLF